VEGEHRPRLTDIEIRFIVKMLREVEENSRDVAELLKLQIQQASDPDKLKELEDKLFFCERQAKAADGVAQRFEDLLEGKTKGRIKRNSRFAQMLCHGLT